MALFERREPTTSASVSAVAIADARHLVLELARRRPVQHIDPMQFGIVLEPGEFAARAVPVQVRSLEAGLWSAPEPCLAMLTDRRVLLRRPHGELVSMWWSTVVGVEVDVPRERVVLDFGNGCPCGLFGPTVPVIGVMAVACLYGIEGLVRHPGLGPLRDPVPVSQP
ncbi:hypothetical protein N864_05075 [Intrasporangium chromatireducens Q5-1]|uniref:Uncharacterized protein n=1 Tax=Intrasporangium chromatireducens Q5-1 TaxID=584657 RepID=W9GGK2_9MICO|nr:hypothetical protein [Intrasporangium chromatireducens]EWT05371.1 hypothetical protein N864_05075 [Intrasporangium chromatireducens Q5-1]